MILAAFKHFDKNNNGKLSSDELRRWLQQYGDALDDAEFEQFLREADTDNTGEVDYQEFSRFLSANTSA